MYWDWAPFRVHALAMLLLALAGGCAPPGSDMAGEGAGVHLRTALVTDPAAVGGLTFNPDISNGGELTKKLFAAFYHLGEPLASDLWGHVRSAVYVQFSSSVSRADVVDPEAVGGLTRIGLEFGDAEDADQFGSILARHYGAEVDPSRSNSLVDVAEFSIEIGDRMLIGLHAESHRRDKVVFRHEVIWRSKNVVLHVQAVGMDTGVSKALQPLANETQELIDRWHRAGSS